ncbi:FAD-binding oxidoreductase [Salipiger mucosus]|uniref:D-lactate dehydrogenase (cytochrome) n=1 Tax=Salipiger mucosus DSM 16094 TaxID=1123237 RepID=S9QV58_9RHOB|nr:FAD-linked oxidase C-terminal domain-containing protein [Salipiger mucosus]EPX85281.1 D-Lactate dehydrogenase, cytochrome c-dependent [Salipiger mucosus DSM 16094]
MPDLAPLPTPLDEATEALRALLGDRLVTSGGDRRQHSHGEGLPDAGLPDMVAYPETTEEVAELARICTAHRIAMVPYGAGSSLEGQVAALNGGVSVDLTRMNRVLEVSPGSLDCHVQAGVTRMQLNAHLRDTGLFFPLDPGADATLGGMAATRASGTNAVGYGTMREVVLALTVVTPDGRIIRTGSRARKSATGYDLTRLYVGSEGTLGFITELRLRLVGQPEAVVSAVSQFPSLEAAVNTATMARQMDLRVVRLELLDEVQTDACIRYSKLEGMAPKPTLFVEFHGTPAAVREQAELFHELARDMGALSWDEAETPEARTALWTARHHAYEACIALVPGSRNMGTDACVPIEHLAACLIETQADVRDSGLTAPIVGHVGDGNFHLGILFDPEDKDQRARADALAERVSLRAIRYGGTCSGEHGVGLHKTRYLAAEHGEALEIMRALKAALDSLGLMNPGKLIPEREAPPTG